MKWHDEDGFYSQVKNEERYGIFLDMGVGKTALCLALSDYKLFQKDYKKILIITPKFVSESTWQEEIAKWDNFNYMTSVLQLINGTEKQRIKQLDSTGDYAIHIISSGLVSWLDGKKITKTAKSGKKYKKFIPNEHTPDYDLIILDECSQFKDTTTARFKALKKILKRGILLLSGTPFSNITKESDKYGNISYVNADELYYIFNLLNIYKRTLTEFRIDFCFTLPWDKFNYRMKPDVYETLISAINEHSIRKQLDIKVSKEEHIVYCDIDESRMKTLTEDYYLETEGDEEVMVLNKANMINKSLQLSNGFVYDETEKMIRINTIKFEMLQNLLSVINDNIIIFYNFVEDKEYLLEHLEDAVLFEGDEQLVAWNKGEIKILILSPFSQKYGLNLQYGGHTIIWFGLIWSGESYKQANARLYRRDQEQDVSIYYMMGRNCYDDYVYNKLVSKITLIDDFISYIEKTK